MDFFKIKCSTRGVSLGGLDSSRPPSFRAARPSAPPLAIVVAGRPSLAGAAATATAMAAGRGRTLAHVDTCPCERRARRPCRRPRYERATDRPTERRQECILWARVSQNHSRNPNRFQMCLRRPSNFGLVCETAPRVTTTTGQFCLWCRRPRPTTCVVSPSLASHSLGSQGRRARQHLATFTPSSSEVSRSPTATD